MEIRDFLHGSIKIDPHEWAVIDSVYFQRLRAIKQLGFAEFSYPSATHNRYSHSLGAMRTATLVWEAVVGSKDSSRPYLEHFREADATRLRACLRLAALLHDVGHGPLSHTTEFAMPKREKLGLSHLKSTLPDFGISDRKANHEDYTLKILLDSPLTPILEKASAPWGFSPLHVAALIDPSLVVSDDFFRVGSVSARPLLQQIISSELDADRMDYLRRDSSYAGVTYGQFDFEWLVQNLRAHEQQSELYLCLQHRALYAFEDFLLSRFHMFLMVYFHHKSIVFDEMLSQYFHSDDCTYTLPSDIEAYLQCTDAHLYGHLAKETNRWARRITEKRPYRMLMELHSGIPSNQRALESERKLLEEVKAELNLKDAHFLETTSTSELSKYFRKPGAPIYVRYDNHWSEPSYIPIEECTNLFEKYAEKRSISRLYVAPERFREFRSRHQ
jgi:HD superfamily phosphohydrolase